MVTFSTPITKDSFPGVWRFVARKYRSAKTKAAIRKYAFPVGQILFFPAFLILALGALFSFTPTAVQALLKQIPVVPAIWESASQVIFASAQTPVDYIIQAAGVLYLPGLAAFFLISLIICIFCRTAVPKLSKNDAENAQNLWTYARHAQVNSWSKEKDLGGTFAWITGILFAVASVGIFVCWLIVPGYKDLLAELSLVQHLQQFGLALVLIFSYRLFNLPLYWIMKIVSFCRIPKRMVETTEIYWKSLRKTPVVETAPAAAPAPEAAASEPAVSEETTEQTP